MTPEATVALVAESVERLWSPEGADALAYLMGTDRNLTSKTIRAARLGFAEPVEAKTAEGHPFTAWGIVVPWMAGDVPTTPRGDRRSRKRTSILRRWGPV